MSKTKEWYMREHWKEIENYSTDKSKLYNIFSF
jgi:hypothetical protein